jgi:UDPglucose 6-dehydrogenase
VNIGFVGLGKLGLPVAAAMGVSLNKTIYGYDANPSVKKYIENASVPYHEQNVERYLQASSIMFVDSLEKLVHTADTLFIAVQTPHEPEFEGVTPIPDSRSDFDYSYLLKALSEINQIIKAKTKKTNIVVISTVLPGTFEKHVLPIFTASRDKYSISYNPYFIAMGTTIEDFLNPEFVLLGGEYEDTNAIASMYRSFINAPVMQMSIPSAEIVKVAYNTFIGLKITFANSIAEIVEKIGGNSDEVMSALLSANKRLISTAYMTPGMADGGGCHPRDQIAMSWFAKEHSLSFDIFESLAKARDRQTENFANIIADWHFNKTDKMDVVILGDAYKKNIGLTVGSPSRLLQNFLKEKGVSFTVVDPFVNEEEVSFKSPKIFFVATQHDCFKDISIPIHSTVIDPWGQSTTRQYGVRYINIGRSDFP